MIIVKLKGGLGNQMFQYAIGRQLAIHYKAALKIDTGFYTEKRIDNTTPRSYQLNNFFLNVQEATAIELARYNVKKNIAGKIIQKISGARMIYEPSFVFDPNFFGYGGNCCLDGHWQSELYFKNINDTIRSDFNFRPLIKEANAVMASKIKACNAVSIHIRRGDYFNNPETNQYHGLCSKAYYLSAIELIQQERSDPHFFFFSDDISWVQNNFSVSDQFTIVSTNDDINGAGDMYLMSLCRYHIIANSSFSWWGAWLNSNSNKMVIAPAKWLTNPLLNTRTLLPENWIKL